MLKKNITRAESLALAKDLGLTKYVIVDKLIEDLQIDQDKEINLLFVTTVKEVAECLLSQNLGIEARLQSDRVFKLKACYGNSGCTILTEYGELAVNDDLLKKALISSLKDIECSMEVPIERLKNMSLTLIYTPEYKYIDNDTWRYLMLKSDKTILILSANHLLYTGEQEFIHSHVIPFYSPSRLVFGIGNAQYIKSAEWTDAVARVHMQIDEKYIVFPVFTEELSNERRSRYPESDLTIDLILSNVHQNLIDLRKAHFEDLDAYKSSVLEAALINLKSELERSLDTESADASAVEMDQNMLIESRNHLESSISLFLESPLVAKYRTAVEQFTVLLKNSLKEDIQISTNIKQDSRALPRYLTAIWEQFSEYQNLELYSEFEREASMLIDMMNLDLRHITRNIRNFEIKSDIKEKLDSAYSVHTFFARKTSSGNGLTDALTIGGLLATIFTPYGLVAVLASELVKIAGKESIDNEYKKVIAEKISDVIECNKEELIRQSDRNFTMVAEQFHNEIMNYYDEVIGSIGDTLNKEKERLAHAAETIDIINKYI
ncbi:MAG: hypothetical protein IJ190_05500 [Prevotella sp.]|nr:hypothetical protein [Prevotella sp.]